MLIPFNCCINFYFIHSMHFSDDFGNVLEALAFSVAYGGAKFFATAGAKAIANAASKARLGVTAQKTASTMVRYAKSSVNSVSSTMRNQSLQKFTAKVSLARFDALAVGQKKSAASSLSKFLSTEQKGMAKEAIGSSMEEAGIATGMTLFGVSNKGEYANGKLYVVRGGPKFFDDGSSREEPLSLELYEQNKRLELEPCECIELPLPYFFFLPFIQIENHSPLIFKVNLIVIA